MLRDLELENFKPFGSAQRIPLAPITLLYGPNSGGKSSIIQALLLLKQSLEDSSQAALQLVPRGRYTDLGSIESLVYRHDLSRPLRISLSFDDHPPAARPRHPWDVLRQLELEFDFRRRTKGSGTSSELRLLGIRLSGSRTLELRLHRDEEWESRAPFHAPPSLWETPFTLADEKSIESLATYLHQVDDSAPLQEEGRDYCPLEESVRACLRTAVFFQPPALPTVLETEYEDEDDPLLGPWVSRRARSLRSLGSDLERQLKNLVYLGPLRAAPTRHHVLGSAEEDSLGVHGEYAAEVIALGGSRTLDRIAEWFAQFEIPYELSVRSIGDEIAGELFVITLTDTRTGTDVSPSDVGFGIGQLLPIIVAACLGTIHTVCVEQPELHLHPRLQSHLADLLIDTTVLPSEWGGATESAWIVETHSEALMLRLQRRIREGRLDPRDVSVLFVDSGPNGSRVVPLRLDGDGAFLDEWPGGFFDEAFRELLGG